MNNSISKIGWQDFLLSAVSCTTVLMSAGISVRNTNAGIMLTVLCLIGHFFAALGPRPKWIFHRLTLDGILFAAVAMACLFGAGHLNRFLPDDGFPPQLMYTAGLCWVMAFGSFFSWRDSTLLFLGVPAIALYGLVGAFDTFPFAPVMFFGFLVCTGTLFARSHLRNMLRLAAQAGEGDWDRLRGYAWKSLAGPEWALISAVVVIAFSALGAPFIRSTVQGATTPLRDPLRPSPAAAQNPINTSLGRPDPNRGTLRVGSGPYGRPSEDPVMIAVMPDPVYLRGEAFYRFDQNQWTTFELGGQRLTRINDTSKLDVGRLNPEFVELNGAGKKFSYQLSSSAGQLPGPYLPGVLSTLSVGNNGLFIRQDGILRNTRDRPFGPMAGGISYVPDRTKLTKSAKPGFWRDSLQNVLISDRVRLITMQAIRGAKNDYEKAEALRRMVSQRIRYNLQAAQIAEGKDVVDTVLFETQEGYCDLYATSLAIVARAVGLPSRVASGYLVSDSQELRTNEYLIRESDYHAWTEIYFEGAGWVTFDATDGAAEVDGFGRGEAWREKAAWYQEPWAQLAGNVLIAVCLVGLVGALVWDSLKGLARRRARISESAVQGRGEFHSLAVKALSDIEKGAGIPRKFPETPAEFVSRVSHQLPSAEAPPPGFADRLNAMLYGNLTGELSQFDDVIAQSKAWAISLKKARKSS